MMAKARELSQSAVVRIDTPGSDTYPVNYYERAHQRSLRIRTPELLPPAASDCAAV